MLRARLSRPAAALAVLLVAAGTGAARGEAPPDTSAADSPGWLSRQLNRWFAGDETEALAAQPARPGDEAFAGFAGRRIRYVVVLRNKAFGSAPGGARDDGRGGAVATVADGFESLLDNLYTGTRERVVREYLLFDSGDRVDPFRLADSERLLRQTPFLRDARIFVLPEADDPGVVDLVVVTQDTWPWGADATIHTAEKYDVGVYNRNVLGVGLNVQTTLRYTRGTSPEVGHDTKVGLTNLGGTFLDVDFRWRNSWERRENTLTANRGFVHPGIRAVGGVLLGVSRDRNPEEALPGEVRDWHDVDAWTGWAFRLGWARADTSLRMRLIPAVRIYDHDVRQRPQLVGEEVPGIDRDRRLALVGLTLTGQEYYRTSLVFGYGETEDIPAGTWISLVAGHEVREKGDDRAYVGLGAVVPRFLARGRYVRGGFVIGGYVRDGTFEEGVLDVRLDAFSRLYGTGAWDWRHFARLDYVRGINQPAGAELALDSASGIRALSGDAIRGQQRLVLGMESVAFAPFDVLGFQPAFFTFAEGGWVAPESGQLFQRTLHGSFGLGVRLRNPSLVFPTLQARAAMVRTADGWDTVLSFGSGSDSLLDFRFPGPKPEVVAYR